MQGVPQRRGEALTGQVAIMNTLEIIAEPSDPYLGIILHSRYRLDEQLGSGAMGAVYRARDLQRDAACAVKLLAVSGSMREAAGLRFLDEAKIVADLFHPNIVEVYDHGEEADGTRFLVMELLQGQDLESLLKSESHLPLEETLDIVRQIGSALHTVHRIGIVHRDIKPRNIFLCANPTPSCRFAVKVIDFGLAKLLHEGRANRGSDGLLIGTPEYLPPEAWRGVSAQVDARADQWSLAVLTFRMLSGQMPFDIHLDTVRLAQTIKRSPARRLRDLVPTIPAHIDAALARALAKDKTERFANVLELVRALLGLPQMTNRDAGLSQQETVLRPAQSSDETSLLPIPIELQCEERTVPIYLPNDCERTELVCITQRLPSVPGPRMSRRRFGEHWSLSKIGLGSAIAIGIGLLHFGLMNLHFGHAAAPQHAEPQPVPASLAPRTGPPAAVAPLAESPPNRIRELPRESAPRSMPKINVLHMPATNPPARTVRRIAHRHYAPQQGNY